MPVHRDTMKTPAVICCVFVVLMAIAVIDSYPMMGMYPYGSPWMMPPYNPWGMYPWRRRWYGDDGWDDRNGWNDNGWNDNGNRGYY